MAVASGRNSEATTLIGTPGDARCGCPYWLAIGCALAAACALAIDVPVAQFFRPSENGAHSLPSDVRKLVSLAEVFAHGTGVASIVAALFVLDRNRRRAVLRILVSAFGAGLAANGVKLFVARIRPHEFDFQGGVWETFSGAATLGKVGAAIQSFPSGHTATAVGLAAGLAGLYPHGRWLFATFALLAALQRIEANAHYPSDVLAAAALGCLCAGLCRDPRFLGRWFDRWERRGAGAST